MQIKTRDQVKKELYDSGTTVASWASEHGLRDFDVYKVLNGQSKFRRGIGHQIAIALGLKTNPKKPSE